MAPNACLDLLAVDGSGSSEEPPQSSTTPPSLDRSPSSSSLASSSSSSSSSLSSSNAADTTTKTTTKTKTTATTTTTTLTQLLDEQADTQGLSSIKTDAEDWTDVKHSERKKRDRILDDGVLFQLMKKSNYQGFKRLTLNLTVMALTAAAICHLGYFPLAASSKTTTTTTTTTTSGFSTLLWFVPLYVFYGFQFQCFAFAGQHEFVHRNAFKTKWINDLCLFVVGCVCFELGVHERVMHKQHHTFTNHIDKDPELTSYYSREELEHDGFRNVPSSRYAYFRQFWNVLDTWKCRLGRLFFSAMGIAVDYSGTGWSLKEWTYSHESGILQQLQRWALAQLTCDAIAMSVILSTYGWQPLLFWWILPVLVGYAPVNYVRNLEHANCEVTQEFPNCLRNTRSVASNLIIRTLLWDTNYHAEHHCYPMVPFFNLHKIHALLKDHVINNEREHFTTQNWAAVMPGGWIDQQQEATHKQTNAKAAAAKKQAEKQKQQQQQQQQQDECNRIKIKSF